MKRWYRTVPILVVGAFGMASASIASAEEPDKTGRIKVKMPATQELEVPGSGSRVEAPTAAPTGEDPATGEAQAPATIIVVPEPPSEALRPPIIDDRSFRSLDDAGDTAQESAPQQERGATKSGEDARSERKPGPRQD